MKNLLFIAATICFIGNTLAQNFNYGWHSTSTSIENNQAISNQIYNDTLYSFFIMSGDSLDTDPGINEDWITSHDGSNVNGIYYFTKITTNGNYISSHKLIEVAQSYSQIGDVEISNSGQIIVSGYSFTYVSSYDLDFDPSSATVGSYSRITDGYLTFIAFYNLNGDYSERIEYAASNTSSVYFSDMSINEQNELVLAGVLNGTMDLDFTAGIDSLSCSGPNYDALVMKIDLSNQVYMWSKSFGNTYEVGIAFVEAKNNKIFLMGSYTDVDLDLDPSISGVWNVNNLINEDAVFLATWSNDGDFISGMGIYGEGIYDYVELYGLAVDDQSNIFVSGYATEDAIVDLDPTLNTNYVNTTNNDNIFLAKYNANYALLWAKNIQSNNGLNISNNYYESNIIISETYLAFMAESGSGVISYSDQSTLDTLSNGLNYGIIIAAINPYSGKIYNQVRIEGNDSDNSYTSGNDFALDQDQNFHIIGDFNRRIDFNQFDFATVYDTSFLYFAPNNYSDNPFNLMLSTQNFLSVNEVNSEIDFTVYPNPSSGIFTLQTKETITKTRIFDLSGKLIAQFKDNSHSFDLSKIEAGYYLMKVETKKGIVSAKIQKL